MSAESDQLYERAAALHDIGRFDESKRVLAKLLGADPRHYRANCLAALNSLKLQTYAEAVGEAERAIGIAPQSDWGHRLRSSVLLQMGLVDEALVSADHARRVNPGEPLAWIQHAKVMLAKGRLADAEASARESVRLSPASPDAQVTLGSVHLKQTRYRDAEQAFRRALQLAPASAVAHNDLGVALLRRKRLRAAVPCFVEALRLSPSLTSPATNLALVLRSYRTRIAINVGLWIVLTLLHAGGQTGLTVIPAVLAVVMAGNYWMVRRAIPPAFRQGLPRRNRGELRQAFAANSWKLWFALPAVVLAAFLAFMMYATRDERNAFQKALRANRTTLEPCRGSLNRPIYFQLAIDEAGHATAMQFSDEGSLAIACIGAAVHTWRFPPSGRGLQYSQELQPARTGGPPKH